MILIRKNIVLISLLTICIQLSIIFSFIVHNHFWHSLKLYSNEYIDNTEKQNHHHPFTDESGLCRINNFIQNNFYATIVELTNELLLNELSLELRSPFGNHYKSLFNYSSGLRGPPLT